VKREQAALRAQAYRQRKASYGGVVRSTHPPRPGRGCRRGTNVKRVKSGRAVRPTPEGDRPRRAAGATVRRVALLALGLVLVAGLVAAVAGQRVPEQVYTVAQVRAGLARQPAVWAGQTVLVRGVAAMSVWVTGSSSARGISCSGLPTSGGPQSCPLPLAAPSNTTTSKTTLYLTLVDDSVRLDPRRPVFTSQQVNRLTLVLTVQHVAPNPLIALARRLPPLARFFPTQAQVPGGVSRLYRIRLRPTGSAPCTGLSFTCATGVLVDAQP